MPSTSSTCTLTAASKNSGPRDQLPCNMLWRPTNLCCSKNLVLPEKIRHKFCRITLLSSMIWVCLGCPGRSASLETARVTLSSGQTRQRTMRWRRELWKLGKKRALRNGLLGVLNEWSRDEKRSLSRNAWRSGFGCMNCHEMARTTSWCTFS